MFEGLFRYKQDKRYAFVKRRKDDKLHLGYDYSRTLLKNAISQHILRNPTVDVFVSFIQDYYMNTVRQIRIMKNWKN